MPKIVQCFETPDTEGLMHNCKLNGCNCTDRSCIGFIMAKHVKYQPNKANGLSLSDQYYEIRRKIKI